MNSPSTLFQIANLKGKLEREAKRANTLEEKNSELDKRRVSESDEAREAREKLSKKSNLKITFSISLNSILNDHFFTNRPVVEIPRGYHK